MILQRLSYRYQSLLQVFIKLQQKNMANKHYISQIQVRLAAILKICKLRKMLKGDKVSSVSFFNIIVKRSPKH